MGTVHYANFRRSVPVELTKKQVAVRVGKSTRWVEQQTAKGMPSTLDRGKRMYPLMECLAWLESQRKGAA